MHAAEKKSKLEKTECTFLSDVDISTLHFCCLHSAGVCALFGETVPVLWRIYVRKIKRAQP